MVHVTAPWGEPKDGWAPFLPERAGGLGSEKQEASQASRAGPEQGSLGAQAAPLLQLPSLPARAHEDRPLPSPPSRGLLSQEFHAKEEVEGFLYGVFKTSPHPWPQGLGLAGPTLLTPDLSGTRFPAQGRHPRTPQMVTYLCGPLSGT